jgi:hypothetical protein
MLHKSPFPSCLPGVQYSPQDLSRRHHLCTFPQNSGVDGKIYEEKLSIWTIRKVSSNLIQNMLPGSADDTCWHFLFLPMSSAKPDNIFFGTNLKKYYSASEYKQLFFKYFSVGILGFENMCSDDIVCSDDAVCSSLWLKKSVHRRVTGQTCNYHFAPIGSTLEENITTLSRKNSVDP